MWDSNLIESDLTRRSIRHCTGGKIQIGTSVGCSRLIIWFRMLSNVTRNIFLWSWQTFWLFLKISRCWLKERLCCRGKAVWLVPTPDFQTEKYSQREWVFEILKSCDEPETAFQNWMRRDAGFADFVVSQVKELNLHLLPVDGSRTIEENAATVAKHFEFY